MANSQLLGLQKESTSPQPRTYVPIAPPIKAPTIPIMIVTSQPPGSLPGWIGHQAPHHLQCFFQQQLLKFCQRILGWIFPNPYQVYR